jgi:hypothetical protein
LPCTTSVERWVGEGEVTVVELRIEETFEKSF